MRYAVITRHRGEFTLRLMCRMLEVSPSRYYAWRTRSPSWHTLMDELVLAHVRIAHHDSGDTYGAPRVQRERQAEGLPVSTKRVARLMRRAGLVARRPKPPRVSTTNANHEREPRGSERAESARAAVRCAPHRREPRLGE